ncbi:HAMP domain-containing histidine kinase [Verrucomicrobiaceae bacterium N1E253]|uniref:histidine kinase n=1 Tax=Oceaniferula marina TaxID=2748318 RepID=A0A851GGA5_9BACT|nr:HAMP domain-containing sensor histidine kinase [Oceaniferula marina]NWK54851.1 HAMP domain-containing histidine kinase [Oceaniferula marina]
MGDSQSHSSSGRGGLFRKFILPQVIVIGLAGVCGMLWSGVTQAKKDHEHLVRVASSNAELARSLNLPYSKRLASHLSSMTGFQMGFVTSEHLIISAETWNEEQIELAKRAVASSGEVVRGNTTQAAASPTAPGGPHLVAMQTRPPLISFSEGNKRTPLIAAILLAIASAFITARTVVKPLSQLATSPALNTSDGEWQFPPTLTDRRDEIGLLANTLNKQRSALIEEQKLRQESEKMALLGNMATSLAHEIKNPAAAIIMHAKVLEQHRHSEQGQWIREEGEQIVSLVNQWLYVAKPQPPNTSNTDLAGMLRDLQEKMRALLDFHHCSLNLSSPDSLMLVCDQQRIEQAFRNLIHNAVQAMPEGGQIRIILESKHPDEVEFTISDEGPGFTDSAIANLGKTFYSEREGGMGLGLSLVAGVIHAHGGSFTVKNQSSGGATVSGRLPSLQPERSPSAI